MSKFYYLISTLPAISLWEKPEIDVKSFLSSCREWLCEKDMKTLEEVHILPPKKSNSTLLTIIKWYNWETCLRNRIARYRSSKLDIDLAPFLHEECDFFSESDRIVQEATASDNPLDKEKALDEQRWIYLNSLEAGHIFNLDLLCIYKLKLQLCEKWLDRVTEKGKDNFNKTLDELYTKDLLKIN